ncbi:dGTP triphosphohydrolase [Lacunimicrobium album]
MGVDWKKLLSPHRTGRTDKMAYADGARNDFERDFDRIAFSSGFRRMQDKTQVFPLSSNDFTRTRLTHSIEVSCVGRSLARRIAETLNPGTEHYYSIGSIVAAACLCHDIGNPPFGHSGEHAIQTWAIANVGEAGTAKTFHVDLQQQLFDLWYFEGNAQAIRVITRRLTSRRHGGLQLTAATLGSMMKYPCSSVVFEEEKNKEATKVQNKKFGYFHSDYDFVKQECFDKMEMVEYEKGGYFRHPLAFVVEAADDICYAIIDLEDSIDQNLISCDDAIGVLVPLAARVKEFKESKYNGRDEVQRLQSYAIQALIDECHKVFCDNVDAIFQGDFSDSLLNKSDLLASYSAVTKMVKNTAYCNDRVLSVELAGYEVISGLLNYFVPAIIEHKNEINEKSQRTRKLLSVFPRKYLPKNYGLKDSPPSDYDCILAATDYITGMTDSFAVDMYQKLSGIKLPA